MPRDRPSPAQGGGDPRQLRAWLEYVVETAIELLDALDAGDADLEDDELGDVA